MRLGNGKFENTTFNSRLQPIQIGLGSSATSQNLLKLNFDYGGTDNNGNVKSQTITTPTVGNVAGFTAVQNYSYDSLNRLKSAVETIPNQTGWKQTFIFDRYGNRTFDTANNNTTTLANGCPVAICNPTANPNDNKLVGTNYDSNGNTSHDANGQTFVYDAENKQVQVNNAGGIVGQYWYNGDGQRVKKYVPSTQETTIFVYDASNKLVAEYSTITASQTEAKISYLTNDHLGSPRITTDGNGQVVSRRDFMPFGEEITRTGYGSDSVRQKFTGYERDNETNLDYAKARMFGSSLGRFTSPDNFLNSTRPQNPASWNLYVYALNNPLRYIDPSGEIERDANGNVIFHKTGEDTIYFKKKEKLRDKDGKEVKITVMKDGKEKKETAYVTISWKADVGYVKANDGTEIQASKATTDLSVQITDKKGNVFQTETDEAQNKYQAAGSDNTSDCHGTTFASGQVWINNPEVEKLMVGDGYRQVKGAETVQKGDVGIYSSDGSLSTTQHSVTFNQDFSVISKGGITKLNSNAPLGPGQGTAWKNEKDKLTVWTQRAKPKN